MKPPQRPADRTSGRTVSRLRPAPTCDSLLAQALGSFRNALKLRQTLGTEFGLDDDSLVEMLPDPVVRPAAEFSTHGFVRDLTQVRPTLPLNDGPKHGINKRAIAKRIDLRRLRAVGEVLSRSTRHP